MKLQFVWACIVISLAASVRGADDRHVVLITMDGFPAYIYQDPRAPIPTLRKLAAQGVAAEGMKVANPSVTWPNHTTLVTGVYPAKHSVLFNGLMIRDESGQQGRIDPNRTQADLVAVPTLWDVAHKSGLSTAAINWPCSSESSALDDCFPDVANQVDHLSPRLKAELLAAEILPSASQADFSRLSSPQHDRIWTDAACYVIRHRKPNLMVLHMLLTDSIQHQYAPQSAADFAAIAVVDSQLRDILAALDDAGIRNKTTVIVTADHGFAKFTKRIQANVRVRKAGFPTSQVQVVPEGGTAFIYFNDPQSAEHLRTEIADLFKGQEGIDDVILPDRFAALGLPDPAKNPRMCGLLLSAKDGYAFANGTTNDDVSPVPAGSTPGAHGYISDNPKMNAMFVAAGPAIRKGAKLGIIQNVSVAPTVAKILGIQLDTPDGKPLDDILTP
ncbi:MAG TPA: alkaline phosphatase family protein [Tepidisphaeraceae bacterium]